jgi:hypothetical protein
MLYLEQLEQLKCGNPDCDHTSHDKALILGQNCHPFAGTKVTVNAMEGFLTVQCNDCEAMVCEIAIASQATIEGKTVGEEASSQLYAALIMTLSHYMADTPDKTKEDSMLKQVMDVINRYRAHYGVDLPKTNPT